MRDQGRLVEWFDDRGYGFIQPNDAHKQRVFLHIKDFARTGPRPIVGCALEYTVILDERGVEGRAPAGAAQASRRNRRDEQQNRERAASCWNRMCVRVLMIARIWTRS